jgi:hypothetical protein
MLFHLWPHRSHSQDHSHVNLRFFRRPMIQVSQPAGRGARVTTLHSIYLDTRIVC